MTEEIQEPKRLAQLDILRAIACILVIISHTPAPANPLMMALKRGGWIGVDLFFVLSGFLVTSLLFREYKRDGRVRAGRFAIRRALKIYPAFYFFLFVTTICIVLLANDLSNISPGKLLAEALFVQNYLPSVWGHTWSLAVEEHFYIAVIILVWSCSRFGSGNPFRSWPPILVGVGVVVLSLRIAFANTFTNVPAVTHLRCDALSMGILLAYLWNFQHDWFINFSARYRVILLTAGILLVMPPFIYSARDYSWIRVYGLTTNYLGSAMILFAVIPLKMKNPGFISSSLAWVGTYSYSIYVWHAVVASWIIPRIHERTVDVSTYVTVFLSLLLSLCLGIVMANIIEFPVLKFRDIFFPATDRRIATSRT